MSLRHFTISGFFLMAFFFIFIGCAPKYASSIKSMKWDEARVEKVVVVPLVTSPEIDQRGLRSAKVDPAGASLITAMFLRGIEALGYAVIPLNGTEKAKITHYGVLPSETVKSIGERTGAEAVLTGLITRYEERIGGPAGVGKPASIGFEANLLSTVDGALLWKGMYAETQKSLLEDVSMFSIFVRRGWKWLSAEELAQYGVDRVLKSLPEVKR